MHEYVTVINEDSQGLAYSKDLYQRKLYMSLTEIKLMKMILITIFLWDL